MGLLIGLLNNKHSTWVRHLSEHLPQLGLYEDPTEYRVAKAPKLLMIHFEALPKHIKRLVGFKKHINFGLIDESHRISNRGSKQSRAASRLSWIRRKVILSGTPIEQKPTDMFGQMRFLAPEVFGTNWEKFESKYIDLPKVDWKKLRYGSVQWERAMMKQRILKRKAKFRTDMVDEFSNKLKPYCIRVTKRDVGIHPAKVEMVRIDPSSRQRSMYDRLESDLFLSIGSSDVSALLPITLVAKLRQVASGFVYDDDQRARWISNSKLEALEDLILTGSKPFVVFAAFRWDCHRILSRLEAAGYRMVILTGETPQKSRGPLIKEFQSGSYDGIVCHLRAGGVGIDLWAADVGYVYSMTHSYIDWDQAKSRLDAIGKEKAPIIKVLATRGTIDEELFELVYSKHRSGQSVLAQLKQRRHAMSKEAKSAKTEKPEAKAEKKSGLVPNKGTSKKYGIPAIVEATGLKPASIRVGLRGSKFKKAADGWGWDTKEEVNAVIAYFKDRAESRPTMKKGEAPATKKRAKAA